MEPVPISIPESTEVKLVEFANHWTNEYSALNLKELDVKWIPDVDWVLVHESHPAIYALYETLPVDFEKVARVDNEYIKVDKQTFTRCCDAILLATPKVPRVLFYSYRRPVQPQRRMVCSLQ